MALSKSFQKGQTILACQMCEEESKIEWKCLLCNFLMCDKCRKVHEKFKSLEEHKIVDLKNIALEQKPSGQIHDFNNIKCDRHAGKICCLFCTDCEEVVCPLCITKAHNTHYMIELSEGFKVAMEVLRDLHASKDEDLTKLNTQRMTLQTIKTEVQARYSEEKQGILDQEKVLTELVHEQSEKLISKLDARLNKIAISIQSDEHQTNADYRATESRNQIFQDAIDSKDMLKVFKTVGKEKKTELRLVDVTKYISLSKFLPVCIEKKTIATFFGNLVDVHVSSQLLPLESEIKLINQYITKFPLIQCIVCCLNGSLWISNFTSTEMQNISLLKDGSTHLNESVMLSEVARMQLNDSDLILSLQKSNLYIFQTETGKLVPSKYTVAPLISNSAFHISKNNKIVVGAREVGPMFPPNGPRKVIVMNMEGEHEMTYYLDNKGRPIFTLPFRITTDNDNNVFVIDVLSEEFYGRVVKLDKQGGVSNIYFGNPAINGVYEPFIPFDLKTTLNNNIIVTDHQSKTLHVLNNMNHCIHYVRIDRELELTNPLSLEIDNEGALFIGTRDRSNNSEAKIYEMKISGF